MTDQSFIPLAGGPIDYASLSEDARFQKWRTGGMVFGIIAIVMGSFSGCMGMFVPLALLASRQPGARQQDPGTLTAGLLVYVVMAVALIWIGIGAMKMQRWVRPLVLVLGTMAIIGGLYMLIAFAAVWHGRRAIAATNGGGQASVAMLGVVMFITMMVMSFFMLAVPGAFVWFYKKLGMKEALEHYDRVPRWTDRCPIPVLGLAILLFMLALSSLMALARPMVPVFGTILHGPPAVVYQVAVATMAFILARLAFKIRPAGWWGTIALLLFSTIAYSMTSLRPNQESLYKAAGFSEQELEALRNSQFTSLGVRLAIQVPIFLLVLGYLLYVRKFFKEPVISERSAAEQLS